MSVWKIVSVMNIKLVKLDTPPLPSNHSQFYDETGVVDSSAPPYISPWLRWKKLFVQDFLLKWLHRYCSQNPREGQNQNPDKQTIRGGCQHKNGETQEKALENKNKERTFWTRLSRWKNWQYWDQRRYIATVLLSTLVLSRPDKAWSCFLLL